MQSIARELQKNESKKLQITTTTGMAAMQYHNAGLQATTIHFWAGILDGRYQNADIINKIQENEAYVQIKNRILQTDILLIDEISMLSKVLFKQIDVICKAVKKSEAPFGGIQVIAGGSFKQLSPIPNPRYQDDGDFCFNCAEWDTAFPDHHSVNLDVIMRTNDDSLIQAISELENGSPGQDTEQLLRSLNRNLKVPSDLVTHLFATKEDVNMYNYDMLDSHTGPEFIYRARDEHVTNSHKNTFRVPKVLKLKRGVPVILQSNISIHSGLVNGRKGMVIQCNDDSVIVDFDGHHETITRKLYTSYDPSKQRVVCSRNQLPLNLGFSVTVHKAQGMSLEHLEVDCYSMFCPGQMAVAIGRATHIGGLRVVNYNHNAACLKHVNTVFKTHHTITSFTPSYNDMDDTSKFDRTQTCCNNITKLSPDVDSPVASIKPVNPVVTVFTEEVAQPENNDEPSLPLVTINDLFSFDVNDPFTDLQSEMVFLYNNIKNRPSTIALWNSIIKLTHSDLENLDNIVDWKPHIKHFHTFLSKDVQNHCNSIFSGLPASEAAQRSLLFKLSCKARDAVLKQEAHKQVPKLNMESQESFDQVSQAVVRYVAGYAIASLRKR